MGKVLPVVVSLLVVLGAFLIPEGRPAEVSALQAYELLELPAGDPPAEGEPDEREPLWEVVLRGPAAEFAPDGHLILYLHGTRHTSLPGFGGDSLTQSGPARASLVRGFRQLAQDSENPEHHGLEIVGDSSPSPERNWGANFEIIYTGQGQQLQYTVDHPDGRLGPISIEREWTPPNRLSVTPPVVAVVLAILFRRPLVALFLAIFSGAYLLRRDEGAGLLGSLGGGLSDVFGEYLWTELRDTERIYIIGFVFFMLAMVGVMTRSGGVRGLMDSISRRAKGPRGTQIATYLMGLAIFFDDYANTILVGSTMRPLADRFKVAREKLAYIVDSTAAPVAGLSIFSTWIAFEVSTFNGQLPAAGLSVDDGYAVFLRTIPYSFYCFLTLVLVGLIAFTGRDFGPMLSAERRARHLGQVLRPGATPMVSEEATTMETAEGVTPRAWRAIVPLLTFIGVTLFEILRGGGLFGMSLGEALTIEGMTQVLYAGSGSFPLLVGSLAGFLIAALGAVGAGLSSDILGAAWTTIRAMAVGFAILYMAWMIGAVCRDLGTAPFLTALVGEAIDGRLLPTILFLVAGVVAFATGSSWSTMSILLPLVVALSYTLGLRTPLLEDSIASGQLLMVMSIGSVLSGAIFGDHCSPISDTTVMSSIASASDHIDHVRTQVPYALLAMVTSVVCGYFPAAYYGLSPWVGLGCGALFLVLVVLTFGKKSDALPLAEPGAPSRPGR